MNPRTVALTAIAPALWGTTYVVTTELLPPGRPLLAAALRALPAGVVLVAITRTLPKGSWWWRAAVLGTLNFGIFFSLLFTAAYRLPGGVAATVGAVQPLVVMALAVTVLGERAVGAKVAAGVVGVVGVGLLVLDSSARLDSVGVAAALAGAVSMATGTVLVQRWGRPVGALPFAGWQLTAGGSVLLPLALVVEGRPGALTATNLAGFGYLAAVGGALAYTLWFRGIERLGARNTTFLSLLSPVVATSIGVVAGDRLTPWQLTGAVAVVASIVTVQVPVGSGQDARGVAAEERVGRTADDEAALDAGLGRRGGETGVLEREVHDAVEVAVPRALVELEGVLDVQLVVGLGGASQLRPHDGLVPEAHRQGIDGDRVEGERQAVLAGGGGQDGQRRHTPHADVVGVGVAPRLDVDRDGDHAVDLHLGHRRVVGEVRVGVVGPVGGDGRREAERLQAGRTAVDGVGPVDDL